MMLEDRSRQTRWIWFCLGFLTLQIVSETSVVGLLPEPLPKTIATITSSLFVLCWLVCAWVSGSRKNLRFGLFLLLYWYLSGLLIALIYPTFVTNGVLSLVFFVCSALTTGPSVGLVDLVNGLLFGGRSVMQYDTPALLSLLLYSGGYLYADLRGRLFRF